MLKRLKGIALGLLLAASAALGLLNTHEAQALTAAQRTVLFAQPTLERQVANLFRAGEQGAWYDPSDLSSMYQESAGITPAAINQPVGLILDKRFGLVRGGELVTNGGFDIAGGWTFGGAGTWSVGAGVATNDGTNGAAAASLVQADVVTSGKTYEITFDLTHTSGTLNVWLNGTQIVVAGLNTSGAKRFIIAATVTGSVYFEAAISSVVSVDNISVREIPGNHASQATAASRPTLKQDANGKLHLEFDGIDDSLATSAIDFTATDKMTVWAGVHKASDATAFACILEIGNRSAAAAGSLGLYAPGASAAVSYLSLIEGAASATSQNSSGGAYAAPHTGVITASPDFAAAALSEVPMRVNGVQLSGQTGNAGASNFGNYPLYIGRRNNASLPFNGRIYSLLIRGAASTERQITQAEKYVNSKTGAY